MITSPTISRSIKYGHLKSLKPKADKFAKHIAKWTEAASGTLSLPPTLKSHIAPIRNKNHFALAIDLHEVVYSIHTPATRLLRVVAHELIHIEQYYEKRLIPTGYRPSSSSQVYQWEGKFYVIDDKHDEDTYVRYPWEIDAFRREDKIIEVIQSVKSR